MKALTEHSKCLSQYVLSADLGGGGVGVEALHPIMDGRVYI